MTRQQLIDWCDRVMFGAIILVVFFLPLSNAVIAIGTSISITFFFIKRGLLISSLSHSPSGLAQSVKVLKPIDHFLVLPVALVFYTTFLSVVASQFPSLSWKAFFGKTLGPVLLFFVVVECVKTHKRLKILLNIFAASAIFVAFDGIFQNFFNHELIFSYVITADHRIMGPFHHPNDFAAYLLLVTTFFIGLLTWAWRISRLKFFIIIFGAVVTAAALGWTFSRGAWIGFSVASISLLLLDRKRFYLPITFLAIFWIIFSFQMGSARNVSFISDNLASDKLQPPQETKEVFARFGGMGREVFWGETWQVAKASPIFGTGLNTFSEAAKRYNPEWTGFYSHNCYLQMLAEIGVLGLGSFIWMMFILTRQVWLTAGSIKDFFCRSVLCALFSGLVGFWVHSALDTNFYSVRLSNLMWMTMALIVAVMLLAKRTDLEAKG